jgi:hypothetical protein
MHLVGGEVAYLLCEQFGKSVCGGTIPVYYRADGMVRFV